MEEVRVCVLTGYGINCDHESAFCFQEVGADPRRVHVNELISGEAALDDFQILYLPGGFSFGDDIASGKVLANKMLTHLGKPLDAFIDAGRLVLGICNGFQVLVRMGLLPGTGRMGSPDATITFNDSGRFEDRWVHLRIDADSPCVFTRGLERIYLPVRHGEGKFVTRDDGGLARIEAEGLAAVRYVGPDGEPAGYPWNPNGSAHDIAGVCDATGRIFGMMPHPEAYNHPTNHPRWTRESVPQTGMGLAIFRNAVEFARDGL